MAYNILMMGASYGSLLAIKLLFGGLQDHHGLPAQRGRGAFNSDGAHVRMPIRNRATPIDLDSRKLPGSLKAAGTGDVNVKDYDHSRCWRCKSRNTAPAGRCAICSTHWPAPRSRACRS